MEVLKLIAEKHKQWVEIVMSFGCNKDTAEDIVQESYIKLHRLIESGSDLMYNDTEINYYYVFRTLNTMFLDLKRKEKNVMFFDITEVKYLYSDFKDDIDHDRMYSIIESELNKIHWYDKKVFEIIDGGETISELSRKSNIGYYSLRNTYKKVLKGLKKRLGKL